MEIEKIVTTKYKVNGIMFDTLEAAELWKQKLEKENIVKMYNDAYETKNTLDAVFVYLKGGKAAQIFIEQAESEDSCYNGIVQGDEGFYYWDNSNEKYNQLELKTLENAYNIFTTYISRLL